jgi:hypothetical protein
VQADPVRVAPGQGGVDGADDPFGPIDEIGERPVPKELMALEGQVRRVDLKQQAAPDDVAVLHRQGVRHRAQVFGHGAVVPVLHHRCHYPGRRRCHESLGKGRLRDERALRLHLSRGAVSNLGNGGRGRHQTHLGPTVPGQGHEVGMVEQVTLLRPLALAAEPGHAVLDIGDKALARLLPVIAHIDTGRHLSRHYLSGSFVDSKSQLFGLDGLPPAAPSMQTGQRGRPGKAAGVSSEDPLLAPEHNRYLPAKSGPNRPDGTRRTLRQPVVPDMTRYPLTRIGGQSQVEPEGYRR